MYDDVATHSWEVADLIRRQSMLTSKTTSLTEEERLLCRMLDTKIEQLLESFINRAANLQSQRRRIRWAYAN